MQIRNQGSHSSHEKIQGLLKDFQEWLTLIFNN